MRGISTVLKTDMSLHTLGVVREIPPSPTIGIKLLADKLKASGREIFDFGVGEMNPTIPLPETFEKGIISALQHNETSYNDCRGDKALRDALSEDLSHNFSLNFSSDCISIHPGPRAALHTALHALLDPREKRNRAVAFSPMYESFTTAPQLLTGFPAIEIPSDSACLPDLVQLKKVITTRDDIAVVVVCSPNNPTGVVYPNHVLEEIANILRPYPNIAVVSDEVYRTLYFGDTSYKSMAHYLPNQTVVVGGISKEISGTGIRLGFAAGPLNVIQVMGILTGLTVSCNNLPVQKGYAEFLRSDRDMKQRIQIKSVLEKKLKTILEYFGTLPGLSRARIVVPQGAFYLFPDVTAYFGLKTAAGKVVANDVELAEYILESSGVVCIPGSKFGKEGHLRLAFAAISEEKMKTGIQKLSDTLAKLS